VTFGSISYLNLLPFQVYLKKRISSTQQKQMISWNRAVPSKINKRLKSSKIDSAFISSIYSFDFECTDLGIVADGAVFSVFVVTNKSKSKNLKIDKASATSNALAKILGLSGEVIIGDRALKYYLDGGDGVDLALEWKNRYNLPFVFARLCYNKRGKKIKRIIKGFQAKRWKIPQYIIKKEAKRRGVLTRDIKWYLNFINYELSFREKKSLKLFQKSLKNISKSRRCR